MIYMYAYLVGVFFTFCFALALHYRDETEPTDATFIVSAVWPILVTTFIFCVIMGRMDKK